MRTATLLILALAISGCGDDDIHSYNAPKTPPPTQMQTPGPSLAATLPDSPSDVVWDMPDGWTESNSDQAMRAATFDAGGIEVIVTALSGPAGGILANVNRWRGQIGLDAIDEASLAPMLTHYNGIGGDVIIADMTGDQRMVAAIVDPGDGKTWFVKATGDPDPIGALLPEFTLFARSFRTEVKPATTSSPAGTGSEQSVLDRLGSYTPPDNWTRDPNASSVVAAAYTAGTGARITATVLGGQGGGILPNINRWRGQVGLEPVPTLEDAGGQDIGGALLVNITGEQASIVAAIVTEGDHSWFFKMTGAPSEIEPELPAFQRFVQRVGLGEDTP